MGIGTPYSQRIANIYLKKSKRWGKFPRLKISLEQLNLIRKLFKNNHTGEVASKAHSEHIVYRIEKAQSGK